MVSNKYIISLIFLLFITYINSYIIIPFSNIKNDEVYNFKDVDELLDDLSYLKLYSEFYIGSSPKKLPVLLYPNIDYFSIIRNSEEQFQSSTNYNPSSSESLKLINSKNKIISYKDTLSPATETFHFLMAEGESTSIYSDKSKGKIDANNYHSFDNICFLKSEEKLSSNCMGNLGFSYPYLNKENNFIEELYKKSLIESKIWSVDFPDIEEDTFKKGNIILGELPHIYNPQYYKENNYFTTKIKKDENGIIKSWKINIDSATIIKKYYENTHKKEIGTSMPYLKTISINFGSYMMHAPKFLFQQLKDLYFDNLFDSGICNYKKIKKNEDQIIIVFCDKKLFDINEQINFPTIYFNVQELGGNFELSYKDVFKKKKDKIFLLISFSSKEFNDTMQLGQIFLYKYKFSFDYEKNEIGVYRDNVNSKRVVHRIERVFRGKKLFVIIFIVIISCAIYFCYKKRYIIKKKLIEYNIINKNTPYIQGNLEQGYELKNDN